MAKFTTLLHGWPVPVAMTICATMILGSAEGVALPDWLGKDQEVTPVPPPQPEQPPRITNSVPYAPSPGRDDRTPVAYLSQVFELGDAELPQKLSGIGPVFWDHSGQGSGALIAPDLVLTTGHLFAKGGIWFGPNGPSNALPAPNGGRIYLAVCNQSYAFKAIHMGSLSPRARLGLDYAVAELATPACAEAAILPVAETPDDLHAAMDQTLLNIGAYRFGDLPRYAHHPLFADRIGSPDKNSGYSVFGVSCKAVGVQDTGDVTAGSTGLILTEGCDAVPGGSGGPLLLSRDGGATYALVGVTNSYRPNTEYNNYTRIEGSFSSHLAQFIDLKPRPSSDTKTPLPQSKPIMSGPWVATLHRQLSQEDRP